MTDMISDVPAIETPPVVKRTDPSSPPPQERASREVPPTDTAEISAIGQSLSRAPSDAEIRVEKVLAIREAIARGAYDTDEKLQSTIDRLRDVLLAPED